jgi:diacylglycerol kinase (ATP)
LLIRWSIVILSLRSHDLQMRHKTKSEKTLKEPDGGIEMNTKLKETTLIYNPQAGGASLVSSTDLEAALRSIGLNAHHQPTEREEDLDGVLEHPGSVVVVAGGDGTIRAVARRLAGRGIPLVILPLGTANNLAGALGVSGQPLEVIARLAEPRSQWLDMGRVIGPWGEGVFLEAAGVGMLATTMAAYAPEDGKSPLRAIQAVISTVPGYTPIGCRVTCDGVEIEGRYVMVEVMNTPAVGPRLRLAPEADPGDGWLDVVLIEEHDRVGLAAYAANLALGKLEALPNVSVRRAKRVSIEWKDSPLHLDAELFDAESVEKKGLEKVRADFALEVGALEVWLPALSERTPAPSEEVETVSV